MTASFEDALLVRHEFDEPSDENFGTTILAPMLLVWTAALHLDEAFRFLRDKVVPKLNTTTMNFWNPPKEHDALMAEERKLRRAGVAETPGPSEIGEPKEFLQRYAKPLAGAGAIEDAAWYQLKAPYVPLLSAIFWRVQLPREMLVKQTLAVTRLE